MNCKVEKTENANEVKLEITVEAAKFDEAMKKVYFKSAKYFNIPGFRKGKAPMNIVEKYYGKEIFYEDAFNDVAQEALEEAVKEILAQVKGAKLVAATKYVDYHEIEKLEALGVKYFGENRVQAFLEKYEHYHGNGEFHFIGTLQTNKVKYIIDKVTLIHSIASYSLIDEVEKQARKHELKMPILVQVNVAKEESKHGFEVEEIEEVFDYLKKCPHLEVKGLMMMAPNINHEETRVYFKQTKELFDDLKNKYPEFPMSEISMGMSNDYKIALEYGATMVRIGSSLFK